MEERGIKAKNLEPLPVSNGHISFVLFGRRESTLNTAKRLREYFQLRVEIFMNPTT